MLTYTGVCVCVCMHIPSLLILRFFLHPLHCSSLYRRCHLFTGLSAFMCARLVSGFACARSEKAKFHHHNYHLFTFIHSFDVCVCELCASGIFALEMIGDTNFQPCSRICNARLFPWCFSLFLASVL